MILVTGGAGFIGSNFVLDWLGQSDEAIINLDILTYAGNLENLSSLENDQRHIFVKGDIGDVNLVPKILHKYKPRAVINFAAESHVDRSIQVPGEFIQTNVVGTFHLLESVRAYWNGLDNESKTGFRFLHVSTDEVYGTLGAKDPAFTENTPFSPSNPYSASKAASDHLVHAWFKTYGLPTLVTNATNNYGPYQFAEKFIPLVITRALAGQDIPVYGDGLQVRDWMYVADHCAALRLVVEAGEVGRSYNIGAGAQKTNMEVVSTLCAILDQLSPRADGCSYIEQVAFVADRPGHDRRYALSASRIESELGWRPVEVFETGLLKAVAWFLSYASLSKDGV